MNNKDFYSNLSGFIMASWFFLHITRLTTYHKIFQSYFLFGECRHYSSNKIYEYLFFKIYEEKDVNFINKLKIKLNTYIDFYKNDNKNLLNSVLTIVMTSVVTVTVTQYTLQGQAHQMDKEFIIQIINKLNDEYMYIFYWVIIAYGIVGIINVFNSAKFEYYLICKNIIDSIEKKEQNEKKIEDVKQLILELHRIKSTLKESKKDTSVVEKIINKLFKVGK